MPEAELFVPEGVPPFLASCSCHQVLFRGHNYVDIEPPESASKDVPLSEQASLASPPVSGFKSHFVYNTLKFEENPEYKACVNHARCYTKDCSAHFANTVLEEQHEDGKNDPLIASKEKVGNDVDAEFYARIKRGENTSDPSPPHLSFNGRRARLIIQMSWSQNFPILRSRHPLRLAF